jgi:hypothetical protein
MDLTSINFTMKDAINLYARMITHIEALPFIALIAIIFVVIVTINLDNKNMRFLYLGMNLLLIVYIIFRFGMGILNHVDSFFSLTFMKNVYFYLANMVFALILICSIYRSARFEKSIKYMVSVFYLVILINLFIMLFMSDALSNNMVLILGNTYPMIYFGNIAAALMYGLLILYWLFVLPKRKKHRLGNHI